MLNFKKKHHQLWTNIPEHKEKKNNENISKQINSRRSENIPPADYNLLKDTTKNRCNKLNSYHPNSLSKHNLQDVNWQHLFKDTSDAVVVADDGVLVPVPQYHKRSADQIRSIELVDCCEHNSILLDRIITEVPSTGCLYHTFSCIDWTPIPEPERYP